MHRLRSLANVAVCTEQGLQQVSEAELREHSDAINLHAPLTEATRMS